MPHAWAQWLQKVVAARCLGGGAALGGQAWGHACSRCCFSLPPEPPTEARPDAAKHRASKAEPCVPVKEKKEKAAQQSSGSVVQAAQDQDPGLALLAGFFTTVADRVLVKGQGK